MKIVASCSFCGHLFKIEDIFEGVDLPCPKCGQTIVIKATVGVDDKGLPSFEPALDMILDKVFSGKATDEDIAKLRAIGETVKEQKPSGSTTSVKKVEKEEGKTEPETELKSESKPVPASPQTAPSVSEKKPSERTPAAKAPVAPPQVVQQPPRQPTTQIKPKTQPKVEPRQESPQQVAPKKPPTRGAFKVRLDESDVIRPPTDIIKRPKYAEKVLDEKPIEPSQKPSLTEGEIAQEKPSYEPSPPAEQKPLMKQLTDRVKSLPIPKLNRKQALIAAALLGAIVLIVIVWVMLRASAERQRIRDEALASVDGAFSRKDYKQFVEKAQEFLKKYPYDKEKNRLTGQLAKAERELEAARDLGVLRAKFAKQDISLDELESLKVFAESLIIKHKGTDAESEAAKTLDEISLKLVERKEGKLLLDADGLVKAGKYVEAIRMLEDFAPTILVNREKKELLLKNLKDYEEKARDILRRGKDAFNQGRFAEAIELLEKVVGEYPYSSSASEARDLVETVKESKKRLEEELFKERVRFGKRKLDAKEWKEAKDAFEAALKLRPDDPELQQLYARAKEGEAKYRNMVLIEEGWFEMGSDDGERDESPKHKVYLKSYYISKTPVTNREYKEFIDANKDYPVPYVDQGWAKDYNWDPEKRTYPKGKDDHPVVLVSYEDALAYCKWAGKRLPTEAEWEKAARGTDGRKYPWGNTPPTETLANFGRKFNGTTIVGSFPAGASPFGILDCSGNVWEWVQDSYQSDFYRTTEHKTNPVSTRKSDEKVVRGGSWVDGADELRCSNRLFFRSREKLSNLGFRVAMDAEQ